MHRCHRSTIIGAAFAALAFSACSHEDTPPPSSEPVVDPAFTRSIASDPASRTAFARFSADSVAPLAACIGAANTSRTVANTMVAFEKVPTSDTTAAPLYVASSLQVTENPAVQTKLDSRGVVCLEKLRGLPLRLPAAVAKAGPRTFARSVTLVMPTAPGGAR